MLRPGEPPDPPSLSGLLLLYKPVGPGSQRLLGAIRRLAGTRRVGHAGTLDPFASGLLPVAVGRATRLVDRVHGFPKTYEAELRLGIETDTMDLEGTITRRGPVDLPADPEVRRVLASFVGEGVQVPPAYSAVKVGGRRAYDVAREGGELALAPRPITIHQLEPLGSDAGRLRFRVVCSSGTYVRVLGRDIAVALGARGHLTRLVRTAIGPLRLADALTLDELERAAATAGLESVLHSPDVILPDLPALALDEDELRRVRNGRDIAQPEGVTLPVGAQVRAYGTTGRLEALLVLRAGGLAPAALLQ